MAKVPKLSDPQTNLLDQVDVFIFDCDGVIWRGDSLIDGIPETLAKLRASGKKMFFVTNNSTKSRKGYKGKFDSLGLDIPAEESSPLRLQLLLIWSRPSSRILGKKCISLEKLESGKSWI
jgi:hypothetical protein